MQMVTLVWFKRNCNNSSRKKSKLGYVDLTKKFASKILRSNTVVSTYNSFKIPRRSNLHVNTKTQISIISILYFYFDVWHLIDSNQD